MNLKLIQSLAPLLVVLLLMAACDASGAEPLRILLPNAASTNETAPNLPVAPPPITAIEFQPDGVTLTVEPVVEGLETPVFVTHAGDGSGRLFVVEKGGTIQLVTLDGATGTVADEPFLDISERVTTGGNEQGLLGLAFALDYAESGYFYVNYSDTDGDTVVARFQRMADDAARADPESEFVILQIAQPARNHNGGMLLFGPDGYLYIGTGDGGSSGDRFDNGQNPDTLLGKMLRIDVSTDATQPYTIPADNPWVATDWNDTDVRDEIWAVGLRNPWRYSFDRVTGDLWIGDVGQNQYEEVHVTLNDAATGLMGGHNYGWPIMEGTHCYREDTCDPTGLVIPVFDYSHTGHCSVTGGYVYRGEQFEQLAGLYLFGDYCSGTIWGTWPTTDGWQTAELFDSGITLSSFGEDEAGELYLTDMGGGRLLRLEVEGE